VWSCEYSPTLIMKDALSPLPALPLPMGGGRYLSSSPTNRYQPIPTRWHTLEPLVMCLKCLREPACWDGSPQTMPRPAGAGLQTASKTRESAYSMLLTPETMVNTSLVTSVVHSPRKHEEIDKKQARHGAFRKKLNGVSIPITLLLRTACAGYRLAGRENLAIWKRCEPHRKQVTLLCYVNTAAVTKQGGSVIHAGSGQLPLPLPRKGRERANGCAFRESPAGRRAGKEGTRGCGIPDSSRQRPKGPAPGRTRRAWSRKAAKPRGRHCRPAAPLRGRRAGASRFARRGVHASLHFWLPAVNICVHSLDSAPLTN